MPKSKCLPSEPACWRWPLPADHREYSPDGMFGWHQSRCAICAGGPGVVIDHDHETGLVRGLLCASCNVAEPRHDGVFALYRKVSPAYMFDVDVMFSSYAGWRYSRWRAA